MSFTTVGGFVLVVTCTVIANLMLKAGAMQPVDTRILGILGWQSVAGLAVFGVGGVLYAILLRRVPLNIAQVFAATQFIGVILAARLVLQEPISAMRWAGILLTCAGITLVGITARE